jgi:hypothetical protein
MADVESRCDDIYEERSRNSGALKLSGPRVTVAFGGIRLRKSRRDASGTKPG